MSYRSQIFPTEREQKIRSKNKLLSMEYKKIYWKNYTNEILMKLIHEINTPILHIFGESDFNEILSLPDCINDEDIDTLTFGLLDNMQKYFKIWNDRKIFISFNGKITDENSELIFILRGMNILEEYIITPLGYKLTINDYCKFLCDTKLILFFDDEHQKIFDALELGCIPIVYTKQKIEDRPYLQFSSISDLMHEIEKLKDDYDKLLEISNKCYEWWEEKKLNIKMKIMNLLDIQRDNITIICNSSSLINTKHCIMSLRMNNSLKNCDIFINTTNNHLIKDITDMIKFSISPGMNTCEKIKYLEQNRFQIFQNHKLKNYYYLRNCEFINSHVNCDKKYVISNYVFFIDDKYMIDENVDFNDMIEMLNIQDECTIIYIPTINHDFGPYLSKLSSDFDSAKCIKYNTIYKCTIKNNSIKNFNDVESDNDMNFGEFLFDTFDNTLSLIFQKYPQFLLEKIPKETTIITLKNQIYDVVNNACELELI